MEARATTTVLQRLLKVRTVRQKIALFLLSTVVMPLSIIGYYGYDKTTTTLLEQIQQTDQETLRDLRNTLIEHTAEAPKDLRFLTNSFSLSRYLQWKKMGVKQKERLWRARVLEDFISFLESKQIYLQLSLLDTQGHEHLRADYDKNSGKATLRSGSDLKDQGKTDDFLKARHLQKGSFYFSAFDLNREHGKVTLPFQPVLRISTPLVNRYGAVRGVLVLTMLGDYLLNPIEDLTHASQNRDLILLNHQGHVLFHPIKERAFAWQREKVLSFQDEYPDLFRLMRQYVVGTKKVDPFLYSYQTISFPSQKPQHTWFVLLRHKHESALAPLHQFTFQFLIAILAVLVVATLLTQFFVGRMVKALHQIAQQLNTLSKGIIPYNDIVYYGQDEIHEIIHSIDILRGNLRTTIQHAHRIASGDYSQDIMLLSSDDQIGTAINRMTYALRKAAKATRLMVRKAKNIAQGDFSDTDIPDGMYQGLSEALSEMTLSLRTLTQKNQQQNWFQVGQAELNDCMRGDLAPEVMAQKILSFLARYLQALVGCLYLFQDDDMLHLTASYAFDQRRGNHNRIALGEGLVGQAALEKKSILFSDVPHNYMQVTSGLGQDTPHFIFVLPLTYNDEVLGVLELGRFVLFDEIKKSFLEQVASAIAVTLHSAQARLHTKHLLVQTRRQAQELEQQHQELIETGELLEKRAQAMEQQTLEIQEKNDRLEESRQLLEEKANELEIANRYRSDFLATMSHEIRTPLNGIMGMADILLATNLTPRQRKYAQTVLRSGESLATLLNDILDLSKIDAGKIELESVTFNLQDIVGDVLDGIAPVAYQKGVEINMRFSPADMVLYRQGDPVRLRQVLLNLVGNAIKFTEEGMINVHIQEQPDDYLLFEVQDTGIGMTKAQQERIFIPFVQADSSTTRKFGGTGLGLAIVQRLINLMNGRLQVESQKGEGSTFGFTVLSPLADEKDIKIVHPPISTLQQTFSGHRVLIIDDHEVNREIIQEQLKICHLTCHTALDGLDGLTALEKAEQNRLRYDMVILDYMMPEMDGLEVAKRMAEDQRFCDIPVIILSSAMDTQALEGAKLSNISHVLTKPVRQSELFSVCQMAMEAKHAFQTDGFKVHSDRAKDQRPQQPVSFKDQSLLIVEDNEINRDVICAMLNRIGVTPTCVVNGLEAVELVKQRTFSLILMDCHMPEMDGLETTRSIRRWEQENQREPVSIVAVTAEAMKEDRQRCLNSGMDDYLSKPFRAEQLLEKLEKYCIPEEKVSSSVKALPPIQEPVLEILPKDIVQEALSDHQPGDPWQKALQGLSETMTLNRPFLQQRTEEAGGNISPIMQKFIRQLPGLILEIQNAGYDKKWFELQGKSHKLKGSAGMLGADRLHQICQNLEQLCLQEGKPTLSQVKPWLTVLQQEQDQLIAELAKELD
ncbi:response regulator [Magnetococcales bacterium HHB-1]